MADIVGIYGLQGCGKTMTLTAFGKKFSDMGKKIYSNYHLINIPYEPVDSLEDLNKVKHGVFLGDELWIWVNARTSMSKMNQEMTRIIMLNRKRGIDIYFTCQLTRTADVILREVTTEWISSVIIPIIKGNKIINWTVKFYKYNAKGRLINKSVLSHNLDYWGKFFNTYQEIGKLKEKVDRPGIAAEEKLYHKLIEVLPKEWVYLLPNSGHGSPYPGEIIVKKNMIDVKGITYRKVKGYEYPIIDIRNRKWIDYFECQKIFSLKPWFAVKHNDWFFVPIKKDSAFLENKTGVSINLLEPKISLKTFCKNIST